MVKYVSGQNQSVTSFVNQVFALGCEYLVGYPKQDCEGLLEFVDIFKTSASESWFDPELRCWQFDLCDSDNYTWLNDEDAIQDIISNKPAVNLPEISQNGDRISILQISDIHYDPKYKAGAPVDCSDILCCRDNESNPNLSSAGAGEYGSLGKCDVPFHLIETFFKDLGKDPNPPEIILWTGDNPQHSIWDMTIEQVSKNALNVTKLIKANYKGQVIPVWGNHGVAPNDQLDVTGTRDDPIRKELADAWHSFIGDEAYELFVKTGYYSVPLQAGPKGRVIVLNSMLHDTINFFLIRDQTDPLGQYQFLRAQLDEAEKNGEIVYIAGHIPPGDGYSLDPFNKRLCALIDRYINIIRGQFFGHTHDDEFKLSQSYANSGQQSGVQFIVPSITTFSFRNPSYRTYEVDKETGFVYDYTQYRMYLSKNQTTWDVAYTMRDFFGVKDGSDYAGFQKFAEQMRADEGVYNTMMTMFASEGTTKWGADYMEIFGCQFMYSVFSDVLACADTLTWESTMYIYWIMQNIVYTPWYKKNI